MSQSYHTHRGFPLTMRISLSMVSAALIPLLVLLIFTYFQTRPALLDQANQAMASDAQTRVQLIDAYIEERMSDAYTITQVPSLQSFLPLTPASETASYQLAMQHATYSLEAGIIRDTNYRNWAIFNTQGELLLNAPQENAPTRRGEDYIPSTYLQKVLEGELFVSPVYSSPEKNTAEVDIYAPIAAPATLDQPNPSISGMLRATLTLDYIWDEIVQNNQGNNGVGSYAFILDNDGIRIADTDLNRRFTSVSSLSTIQQQQIRQENRTGTGADIVPLVDPRIATSIALNNQQDAFQTEPAGFQEEYQVVRQSTNNQYVNWHYFVLSPISTVTAVANQQFISIAVIFIAASLIATILSWFMGRNLARPILRAVGNLQDNSQSLSELATNQHDAASEQVWVVDSSQVGLQSIQYYTEAARFALRQLLEITGDLAQRWRHENPQQIDYTFEQVIKTVKYLEYAMEYQHASNQKMATALKVATQVTEQLHHGATSATEAATHLEEVVRRLQAVTGR